MENFLGGSIGIVLKVRISDHLLDPALFFEHTRQKYIVCLSSDLAFIEFCVTSESSRII
jgi:hypothetical protein